MSNHTPEPWSNEPNFADEAPDERRLITARGLRIAEVTHANMEWEDYEANAVRIVECVNALAGAKEPKELVKAAKAALHALETPGDFRQEEIGYVIEDLAHALQGTFDEEQEEGRDA